MGQHFNGMALLNHSRITTFEFYHRRYTGIDIIGSGSLYRLMACQVYGCNMQIVSALKRVGSICRELLI